MMDVLIDGVRYLPAPGTVFDCDGNAMALGTRVKIRESALGKYEEYEITYKHRYGTLRCIQYSLGHQTDLLGIEFDDEHPGMHNLEGRCLESRGYFFPVDHVRRGDH